jgi:hypothetical protein
MRERERKKDCEMVRGEKYINSAGVLRNYLLGEGR